MTDDPNQADVSERLARLEAGNEGSPVSLGLVPDHALQSSCLRPRSGSVWRSLALSGLHHVAMSDVALSHVLGPISVTPRQCDQ